MYDVIVVGGGCAGLAAAMLLARRSHEVLLVDRSTVPAEGMCAGTIAPPGLFLLEKWGLLGRLADYPLTSGLPVVTADEGHSVTEPSVIVPTSRVEEVLAEHARSAGVRIRERFTVKNVVWDADRVSGIVGFGEDGHAVCDQARVVVGADGRQSTVARTIPAFAVREEASRLCCYYAMWRGLEAPSAALHLLDDVSVAVLPVDGGLTSVLVARPIETWARYKRAPETSYGEGLARLPELAEKIGNATRSSRFFGTADMGWCVRQAAGPGWALTGEASRHAGGVFPRNLTHALIQAQLLAATADNGHAEYGAYGELAIGEMEGLTVALSQPGRALEARIQAYERGAARQLQWVETFHSMGARGSGE